MCSIDGCDGAVLAKGLCGKHYMRLRRTGDPCRTRKSGPKPSTLAQMRALLPEWSERTLSRYKLAMMLFPNAEERRQGIAAASRPNGSVNVSRFLDIAVMACVRASKFEESSN